MHKGVRMKVIVFSDLHYGATSNVSNIFSKRKSGHLSMVVGESLVKRINEINSDIVVNLGDTIESSIFHSNEFGTVSESDFKNIEKNDKKDLSEIMGVLNKIKAPLFSVIGNHELVAIERNEVSKIMGHKKPTFSINLNDHHFVFLGVAKGRILPAEDLMWLEKDIKGNKFPSLYFIHYGVAEDDMQGNWWSENNKNFNPLLENRDELKKILKTDKNLLGVFCGHQHWTKTIVEDGITYFVIGSLVEDMLGDGKPEGIFLEVDIKKGALHAITRKLGEYTEKPS